LAVLGLVPGAAAATASAGVTSVRAPENAAPVTTPDVVLINQPASRVWYQQSSGGSRAYRVLVYNPSGTLIFYRSGLASPTAWALWHIRASRVGNYHTTYKLKNSSGQWFKYRTATWSHRC
jgi:hypothetical protein